MKSICVICLSVLMLLSGCNLTANNYLAINNSVKSGQKLIDPQNGPYNIEVIDCGDGTKDYWWEIDSSVELAQNCSIKYHKSLWDTARYMVVEAQIGENNKYPLVIDTGATQALFLSKKHISENDLAVFPMKGSDINGHKLGLCHLPELKTGPISFVDQPCFYLERASGFSLPFGSADIQTPIILGLPALKEFKYVTFDSINEQIEFSRDKTFTCDDEQQWQKFSIYIEEDFHSNAFLFVELEINGQNVDIQLDTGSGNGLAISKTIWNSIKDPQQKVKLNSGNEFYPFIGNLRCKKTRLDHINLGDITVNNAMVSIFNDDSKLLDDADGLLGMQYFRDKVFVIDFENEYLWIKK